MESIHGIPGESPPKFDGYFGMQRNAASVETGNDCLKKETLVTSQLSYQVEFASKGFPGIPPDLAKEIYCWFGSMGGSGMNSPFSRSQDDPNPNRYLRRWAHAKEWPKNPDMPSRVRARPRNTPKTQPHIRHHLPHGRLSRASVGRLLQLVQKAAGISVGIGLVGRVMGFGSESEGSGDKIASFFDGSEGVAAEYE